MHQRQDEEIHEIINQSNEVIKESLIYKYGEAIKVYNSELSKERSEAAEQ